MMRHQAERKGEERDAPPRRGQIKKANEEDSSRSIDDVFF